MTSEVLHLKIDKNLLGLVGKLVEPRQHLENMYQLTPRFRCLPVENVAVDAARADLATAGRIKKSLFTSNMLIPVQVQGREPPPLPRGIPTLCPIDPTRPARSFHLSRVEANRVPRQTTTSLKGPQHANPELHLAAKSVPAQGHCDGRQALKVALKATVFRM